MTGFLTGADRFSGGTAIVNIPPHEVRRVDAWPFDLRA